ncbi:MAG TPA: flagellar basal body-associated FliL family protein [Burkholderiaceae bacterium]|nr:flagellar basal body-associated FliL family protein [Burkholderiaceae bacterium]
MSAAAAATDAVDVPAKKPGKKKLILMLAVAALVLGGAGAGGLLYMKKQRAAAEAAAGDDDGTTAAVAPAKAEHKADKKHPPTFVPMDNFVVNLADHEADRYAQIGIVLEVPDEHVSEEIKTYLPAIRNNILLLLAHKTSADLAGSEGKETLAREIRREALRAMGEEVEDDAPAASASAPKARKKKPVEDAPEAPIRSVQFASFIIQ